MSVNDKNESRYGVDIRPARVHLECDDLSQVLSAIDSHDGDLTIFDRPTGKLIYEGSVGGLLETLQDGKPDEAESYGAYLPDGFAMQA